MNRIRINRANMVNSLSFCNRLSGKITTMQILNNVLVSVKEDGNIDISGTDLEISGSSTVAYSGDEFSREFIVNCSKILEIFSKCATSEVDIEFNERDMRISSGNAEFFVSIHSSSDFPDLGTRNPEYDAFSVKYTDIARLFKSINSAISKDDSRFQINGALLECADGVLATCSTDGHRLHTSRMEIDCGSEFSVIVPKFFVETLLSTKQHSSDSLAVFNFSGSRLTVSLDGNAWFSSVLLDGSFPDYKRVIDGVKSEGYASHISIKSSDLIGALNRVSLLCGDRSRTVSLSFKDKHATVSSANPDIGRSNEKIYIDSDIPEGFGSIDINPDYVKDAVIAIGASDIEIVLGNDNCCPIVLNGKNSVDATCVIMPIKS